MPVKSVYNFVPAPEEGQVFKPDWADKVSHDIPFSDGESGEISLTITAKTPIFIRNGQAKCKDENKDNDFSNIEINGEKKYFIPATSIKGMVRNVLEIMSFGRLNKSLVNNDRYAFRDLTKKSLYLNDYKQNTINAGWLHKDKDDNWYIVECSKLAFISHEELDKTFRTNFKTIFSVGSKIEDKTAKYKYNITNNTTLSDKFILEVDGYDRKKFHAKYDPKGDEGNIVFTGQSSLRNERNKSGKFNEFVFFGSKTDGNKLQLSDIQRDDFEFIYFDEQKNESEDWASWKRKWSANIPIPIFYSLKNQPNEEFKVAHFGLAYMYKLPFKKSIHETNPISEYEFDKDLAEVIFGFSDKKDSLKGRVMFSHAFSENATPLNPDKPAMEILSNPKASYFPFYLKQLKKNKINEEEHYTYQDKDATLRGFKRYPVRNKWIDTSYTERYSEKQLENPDVFASFIPLNEGTKFTFKLRYHNLKKAELGAILSALTFHNHSDCYHSLGGAKPFGYGKVEISITKISSEQKDCLKEFENIMNKHYQTISQNSNWLLSPQLKELFTMATNPKNEENLIYPEIDNNNDFVHYKKKKMFLDNYSTVTGIIVNIKPYKSEAEIQESLQNAVNITFGNFTELRNWVKREFDDNLPKSLHEMIFQAILSTKSDKESRKTLTKKGFDGNPWQFPICKWFGLEKAQNLYSQFSANE